MMYYSILASFCLLGMASSQKIDDLSACLTKEQNLNLTCKFTPKQGDMPVCNFAINKKVVATTNTTGAVDPTYKNRASVTLKGNVCSLTLTGFSADQPETYVCTIYQNNTNAEQSKTVEKKNMSPCSDANVLKHGGVILLLAVALSLLSGIL
ncbi:thy-1 membrane glycoprotein [Hemibagrus wyckioides]|uniref:thy-1 membrane glycoprotein n=1 Tax=Hemibagrus wyckioides TaxID=337641 RepID=UPI00266DB9B3|nr:thy-1 membrane glycoprotein [Hemibagrus wyckioides]